VKVSKRFFFKKKGAPPGEAKIFRFLGALADSGPKPAVNGSFFASFFSKKEALAYLTSPDMYCRL